MNLEWSPVNSTSLPMVGSIFASGATDKKVKIWDLMRVGFEIPKDLGGTDELLVPALLSSSHTKATRAPLTTWAGTPTR